METGASPHPTTRPLDPSQGLVLFTDGSCSYRDRTGGWAWVVVDHRNREWSQSGATHDTTNNRMELMAIERGLSALYEAYGPCEILVCSDSEYAVLGATVKSRKRKKNTDIWKVIDQAIRLHKHVEWYHVRGHQDNYGNNLADRLAGAARKFQLA